MSHSVVFLSLHLEASPEALGLGAASVAAALESDPVFVPACLEGLVGEAPETLAARVLAREPEYLGFSVYSWNARAFALLAPLLRKARPKLLLFAGGPLATADPLALLPALGVDFLILGEGEEATARALSRLVQGGGAGAIPELKGLPGVYLPGSLPRSAPLQNLANLPSPWLRGLAKPKEGGVLWELARGCPFGCTYCYEGKGEKGIRRFSRQRIEAELDYFVKAGAEQAFVLDPTFDADREGAKDLLALIQEKAPGIHWKFEVRAELLDRDLARRFARLGASLQVGLQTSDPEVSAAVGRPLDLKAFTKGIGHLNAAGAVFGIDLIYGLPRDSLPGFRRSLDFALGLQPNHLDVFPLSVLPGTTLAEEAPGFGLRFQAGPPYALLESPGFSPESLALARSLAEACDLLYSRGRAVAWFLQAARPLKARPSRILESFASWLPGRLPGDPSGLDSRAIEALQLAFFAERYSAEGKTRELDALGDIIRFNAAWGRALAEGQASEFELAYDPGEVLGPGALDLGAFVRGARPRPGRYLVEPSPGEPRFRPMRPGRPPARKPGR